MKIGRLPVRDPRTIARDIPGVFDALFPHVTQGVVASFNRRSISLLDRGSISEELIASSKLQHAMLFEIAFAVAEKLMYVGSVDWDECLSIARARQRAHYDAQPPAALCDADMSVSLAVAENLVSMLRYIQSEHVDAALVRAPQIPGYRWIASGKGDFAVGTSLIEVKCTNKRFSSADYRQVLMYWLLSYCAALESGAIEWSAVILANPRLNLLLTLSFDEIITVVGGGKSKLEVVELFSAVLGNRE